jgi:hypothetical protein
MQQFSRERKDPQTTFTTPWNLEDRPPARERSPYSDLEEYHQRSPDKGLLNRDKVWELIALKLRNDSSIDLAKKMVVTDPNRIVQPSGSSFLSVHRGVQIVAVV